MIAFAHHILLESKVSRSPLANGMRPCLSAQIALFLQQTVSVPLLTLAQVSSQQVSLHSLHLN